jgi:hypothetical protein
MGAEVPGLQLYREGATAPAHSAEVYGTPQGTSPGNHATDTGCKPGGDGGGTHGLLRGWYGHFSFCETPSVLEALDSWLRHRLRSVVWKQWKVCRTRYAELRKRRVNELLAGQTAGSSHGPWRLSQSPVMCVAFPNAFFDGIGLFRLAVGR